MHLMHIKTVEKSETTVLFSVYFSFNIELSLLAIFSFQVFVKQVI
jgi:hypothetical protein